MERREAGPGTGAEISQSREFASGFTREKERNFPGKARIPPSETDETILPLNSGGHTENFRALGPRRSGQTGPHASTLDLLVTTSVRSHLLIPSRRVVSRTTAV